MPSEPDKIVSDLSHRSLGASFLFAPEESQKGKLTERPCDLVWAGNGCILLLRRTEIGRSRTKMSRHNFNPMKHWYKEWHSGRRLRGRNASSIFDISFEQYPHKVLISVVKGNEAVSESNPEVGEDLASLGLPPPTVCATLSENVLAFIAANAGSVPDVLQFLADLRVPLSADLSLKTIRRRHNAAFAGIPADELRPDFRNDPRLYERDAVWSALRDAAATDSLIASLFGDLSAAQRLRLVYRIKHLERKTSELPPGMFGVRASAALFDFSPYLFGLVVSKSDSAGGADSAGEHLWLLQREMNQHAKRRERFSLVLNCHSGPDENRSISVSLLPSADETAVPLSSQTTALLDHIRARSFAATASKLQGIP